MIIISPLYRTRRFGLSILIAVLTAIPIVTYWPYLLFEKDSSLLYQWLSSENMTRLENILTFEEKEKIFYYLKTIPWFSWPAWPFAIWSLWIARGPGMRKREIQLPIVTFVTSFLFLTIAGDGREVFALPLLIPLSLLASVSFDRIPRGAANAFYWFSLMISFVFIISCWLYFFAIEFKLPAFLAIKIYEFQPLFEPKESLAPILTGMFCTLVWIILVLNITKTAERSAILWTSGVTASWVLTVVLLFPWINSIKTYKEMIISLKSEIPTSSRCIYRKGVTEPQRAMLDYFGDILTVKEDQDENSRNNCDLVIVQSTWTDANLSTERWQLIWEGGRAGDKSERYQMYQLRNP